MRPTACPMLGPCLLAGALGAQVLDEEALETTIARVRARPEEQRWRLIDWRRSLRAALAEARELGKPVFLFGYDGVLESGNC